MRGIYKGLGITMLRDSGYSVYFASYDILKNLFYDDNMSPFKKRLV